MAEIHYQRRGQNIVLGGYNPRVMASTVVRAYKGGLGAMPTVGSRDKAPGQGS